MSSGFRITQQTLSNRVTSNLQKNLNRMQTLQEQLSSGRQVNRPSDSPANAVSSLQFRSDMRRTQQLSRNAEDGLGWLGAADQNLQSMLISTRRVRELALRGSNSSNGPNEREAMAVEVDQLRESLLSLANAKYQNRPLFAGTADTPTAYSTLGVYQGDTGEITRTAAPGTAVKVNLNGQEVFGPDATGLFATLEKVAADLRTNPSALSADLGALDASSKLLTDKLAEVGARFNRVESLRDRATDDLLNLQTGLSEVENIDLPQAIMELQLQETAYQAALSAASRVIQPSLVDFLR